MLITRGSERVNANHRAKTFARKTTPHTAQECADGGSTV